MAALAAIPAISPRCSAGGTELAPTDGDSWDLASSVGVTATMVAAGRAPPAPSAGLINDPFAAPLVRAVGIEFFTRMLDGELDLSQIPGASPERTEAMIHGMAVRAKFFDDYLMASTGNGVRQAVILASGLDSRAFRLPWPNDTVVYELDQPEVIAFKTQTLTDSVPHPTATRRTVWIDLREDWPTALRGGVRPLRAHRVVGRGAVDLPAAGSTGPAVRPTSPAFGDGQHRGHRIRPRHHGFRCRQGPRDVGTPARTRTGHRHVRLVYSGERSHAMEYLREHGWRVTGSPRDELFIPYGLPVPQAATTIRSAKSCMSAPPSAVSSWSSPGRSFCGDPMPRWGRLGL